MREGRGGGMRGDKKTIIIITSDNLKRQLGPSQAVPQEKATYRADKQTTTAVGTPAPVKEKNPPLLSPTL